MAKRRIVKLGTATLVVSLPSKWTKKFDLKQGDELNIEEQEKALVISTEKEFGVEKASLDITKLNEFFVGRALSAIHKSGYDEVEIHYEDPKVLPLIQKGIEKTFLGYEIIDQTEKSCLIKCITKSLDEEFDAILRRIFLVTISLGKNSLEIIKKGNLGNLKEVLTLEETNNKLTNFCERMINKGKYPNFKKATFMYCIAWQLEKIADDYKYLCQYLSESKIKLSKELIEIYEKVNQMMEVFYDMFYKFDEEKLHKFTSLRNQIKKETFKLFEERGHKENNVIFYLAGLSEKIFDISGPFMGLIY